MVRRSGSTHHQLVRATIGIADLACGGGGSLEVERRLSQLPGVEMAYVNPLTEMAYISFNPGACPVDAIYAAIRELGFRPGELQVRSRT